jgi:hypothetical protein
VDGGRAGGRASPSLLGGSAWPGAGRRQGRVPSRSKALHCKVVCAPTARTRVCQPSSLNPHTRPLSAFMRAHSHSRTHAQHGRAHSRRAPSLPRSNMRVHLLDPSRTHADAHTNPHAHGLEERCVFVLATVRRLCARSLKCKLGRYRAHQTPVYGWVETSVPEASAADTPKPKATPPAPRLLGLDCEMVRPQSFGAHTYRPAHARSWRGARWRQAPLRLALRVRHCAVGRRCGHMRWGVRSAHRLRRWLWRAFRSSRPFATASASLRSAC